MAMTKRELIQFMDELVELASKENKTRAILVKEKFISDLYNLYNTNIHEKIALEKSKNAVDIG